jgi:beta-N-acetylhexosaminidase
MTAHIVFRDVDPDHPATQSATVIDDVIRREIGFTGLLFSDDLNMAALLGGIDDRARAAIAAGCDVVLHCNGKLNEMVDVASAVGHLGADSLARWQRAALFKSGPQAFDSEAAMAELSTYLPT